MPNPWLSTDSMRRLLRRGALAPTVAVVLLAGCSFLGGRPNTVAPAAKLYEDGERLLLQEKYPDAREQFLWLVERHPESDLAAVARFLVGETYFRSKEFDKAVPEYQEHSSIVIALAAYGIANLDHMLPREGEAESDEE